MLLWLVIAECDSMANVSSAKVSEGLRITAESQQLGELSSGQVVGFRASEQFIGGNNWCRAEVPASDWNLQSCSGGHQPRVRVKVLTYNLFWWNLFSLRGGNGRSSGRLLHDAGFPDPFDFMGFQECDDVSRVMADAGLKGTYDTVQGSHALGMAFRREAWQLLAQGEEDVAEDGRALWYGFRAVQWMRLLDKATGRKVFFVNHHGPLPLSSGGRCGGDATAFNMLRVIGEKAHVADAVIVVGDFNAVTASPVVATLAQRLARVFSGSAFGGVDHIFSCQGASVVGTYNLGSGGSDHDAICSVLDV